MAPHMEYINQALHMTNARPPQQYAHPGHPPVAKGTAASAVPAQGKGAPRFAVSDSNRYKETSTRERSRDDALSVVRDRRVRITDESSLYSLCRSWLRNGINEEIQLLPKEVMQPLPKPLPESILEMPNKQDKEDKDEQEESVDHLSPEDLLKGHIKRAKRVKARFREERSKRIERYKNRLRLLLPPSEDELRNDTAAGN
ncbi:hypothetical protein PIB30_027711 [Stylosanthes scabra]|uniref:SCAN box domain-containing protein n=1 Tax=Stylosanthes scabra TaxID=79078 RepID=A0ABU6VAX5_9FABA|nr:hypothetical protein [Stylosanthes scabra]